MHGCGGCADADVLRGRADYQLDSKADYSPSTPFGQRNRHFAGLLMGVYEALIEHAAMSENPLQVAACSQITQLHAKMCHFSAIVHAKKADAQPARDPKGTYSDPWLAMREQATYERAVANRMRRARTP